MAKLALGDAERSVEIVFLDCDGVIFDANAAKACAFVEALEGYPEEARQALAEFHREHGGLSRYEKFRHFFTAIHPVEDFDRRMDEALARFGELSEQGYEELAPRPEALELVERMGGPTSVHVVSGADQRELRGIFERKGIRDRFADVLGSPASKRRHMATVLYERFCPPSYALMIGDGRTDFETAQRLSIPFVFLREMSAWTTADAALAGAEDTFVAETWSELLSWVR
jgi:phosphoglycolate phosphatase-like HAD superfamily hydrolase